jgi:hypothetical protein
MIVRSITREIQQIVKYNLVILPDIKIAKIPGITHPKSEKTTKIWL